MSEAASRPTPILGDVNPAWVFKTCNGIIIHNIYELKNFLQGCSEYDFKYHVNDDKHKNDFATWVRDVVHDEKLAHELDGELSKERYLRKITARLKSIGS